MGVLLGGEIGPSKTLITWNKAVRQTEKYDTFLYILSYLSPWLIMLRSFCTNIDRFVEVRKDCQLYYVTPYHYFALSSDLT